MQNYPLRIAQEQTYWNLPVHSLNAYDVRDPKATKDFEAVLTNANLTPRQPTLRSSGLSCWLDCRRKFFFKERLGLVPKGVYVPALEIGKLFHTVMGQLLQGAVPERASEVAVAEIQAYQETLLGLADPAGILPNGKLVSDVLGDVQSDLTMARAMALATWSLCPWDFERFEVVEVEQLHTLRYSQLQPIRVRLDLLVRDRQDGGLWIVDWKTTSKEPVLRAATVAFEFQPRLYRMAVQPSYPKERVKGVIHRITKKPSIRYCKKDTDFNAYVIRCLEWYREKMTENPASPPVLQSTVQFPQKLLDMELLCWLQELSRACRAQLSPQKFGKDPTGRACVDLSGRHLCPYYQLCATDMAAWTDLINGGFQQQFRDLVDEQAGAKEILT